MFKAFTLFMMLWTMTQGTVASAQNSQPTGPDNKTGSTALNSMPKRSINMPLSTPNRSVYMNGVDISSSRSQDLRNVHVKISDDGDIYIAAPQYQVTEEETFLPLSTYTRAKTPEHKPAQPMISAAPKPVQISTEPKADSPTKPASNAVPADGAAPGKTSETETDAASKPENTK
jgi:hypothetical protein